jgi:serine/threonine protein kinase
MKQPSNALQASHAMLSISLDLPQMSNFSAAFCDVLSSCLVFEPSQRISARSLSTMDFFSEKSQDSDRLAVFKDHELESVDVRFARLGHEAPIPILNKVPSTPTFSCRWDFGDVDDSVDAALESSFPEISLSSDLHEHRSHLENLDEALETNGVDAAPPDSPHLKALSLEPKVLSSFAPSLCVLWFFSDVRCSVYCSTNRVIMVV